jgi:hypothetical protein
MLTDFLAGRWEACLKKRSERFTLGLSLGPRREPMIRASIAVSVLVAAIALVLSVPVAASPTLLKGTVGPYFQMSLQKGGKDVTALRPGVYRFEVVDKSRAHDFHLVGPGVNKVITSVVFRGKKSVTVKLARGTYRYTCDLHGPYMTGALNVR